MAFAPRGRRWWAGVVAGCRPSPLSYAVPRAPPPQVQLHLVEMIKAKKSGAGHKMYKVCRRVLNAPIVKEDTYCLEVVGKELRGEGEVNAQGEPEGRGTMVYASGNMYEGQWLAGKQSGEGRCTFALTLIVTLTVTLTVTLALTLTLTLTLFPTLTPTRAPTLTP